MSHLSDAEFCDLIARETSGGFLEVHDDSSLCKSRDKRDTFPCFPNKARLWVNTSLSGANEDDIHSCLSSSGVWRVF